MISIDYRKFEGVITIWGAIEKRSHKPIYKTDTKNEATILRVTTFALAKMEE